MKVTFPSDTFRNRMGRDHYDLVRYFASIASTCYCNRAKFQHSASTLCKKVMHFSAISRWTSPLEDEVMAGLLRIHHSCRLAFSWLGTRSLRISGIWSSLDRVSLALRQR